MPEEPKPEEPKDPDLEMPKGDETMLDASFRQKPGAQQKPEAEEKPKVPSPSESSMPAWLSETSGETMLDMSSPVIPSQPAPEATLIPAPDAFPNDDSVPDDADFISKLRPGQRVLGYVIEENPNKDAKTTYLGVGASGIVYRARHEGLQRQVALKFLKRNSPYPEEVEQFKAEAASLANLQGRNILQVYDFSQWKGMMFMAMELLEESTAKSVMGKQPTVEDSTGLFERIATFSKKEVKHEPVEGRKYPVSQKNIEYFVNTMVQVAEQLQIAHDNKILHRDIKPGNIGYRNKELNQAVLGDYGLAVLIKDAATAPAGTPGYMAPEQIDPTFSTISERTDVFGLGATLYNMLTGKTVHDFEDNANILQMAAVILHSTPKNIRLLNKKVDRNLAAIIHKAVEKQPRERYESARAFYEDLQRWMNGKSVKARPITSFCIPTARRVKKRGLVWLSTAVLSGLLFGLGSSVYKSREQEKVRREQEQVRLARVEKYIAEINADVAATNALREPANKSYELLRQKTLLDMLRENIDVSALANNQKAISSVLDGYNKALKVIEDWKKDDATPERKSDEKRRELDALIKEFEKKNEYALQKVSAYERVVEAMAAYKEHDFAKAEKELALALDRVYEVDTQKELIRVQEEHSMYQKQRTMQGVRDIAVRVRAYRRICRACFMDELEVFSGSEDDIAPEKGIEWTKMMTGIEKILEMPDDVILRKIHLDAKTYGDLIDEAKADAQEAFYSEQSILKNKDLKRAIDMKRNKIAEEKYVADLSEKYKGGKVGEEEFKLRMRLPLPSQPEFIGELENEFKRGRVTQSLYDKLKLEK